MRAGIAIGIVAALVAVGTTGCSADRSDHISVAEPTYAPTSLPGGFGAHPLHYRQGPDGYTLTARAHGTTYTVRVRNRLDGDAAIDPARLAGPRRRTTPRPDGTMGWRDQVADVSIRANGPAGHTAAGLRTTARHLVVAPQRVLGELADASRHGRRRDVRLDPVEFPHAGMVIPARSYGRLGRSGFAITSGPVTTGSQTGGMGGTSPERLFGWRDGKRLHTLVLAPRATIVVPDDGIEVERRYVPFNGSDAILLTTERADEPTFAIGVPHQRLHRWTMHEDLLHA